MEPEHSRGSSYVLLLQASAAGMVSDSVSLVIKKHKTATGVFRTGNIIGKKAPWLWSPAIKSRDFARQVAWSSIDEYSQNWNTLVGCAMLSYVPLV
jgi:hypothetical protein